MIANQKQDSISTQRKSTAGTSLQRPEGPLPFSTTIRAQYPKVESLLRNIENFPHFFERLKKVQITSEKASVWFFEGRDESQQMSFAMNLELTNTTPLSQLQWKAEDSLGFDYTVRLWLEKAPADRGTVVRMQIDYDSTIGEWAEKLEALFGKSPSVNARKNLQRLKAFCETGHVPTTEGQPSGRDQDQINQSEKSPLKH